MGPLWLPTMAKRPTRIAILGLGITPGASVPRHRQLYDGIREAILAGRLAPGARLPSTRSLAQDVGCSRNTVIAAFEQLTAEGYLEGRVGAGTTVGRALPETVLRMPAAPTPRPSRLDRRRLLSRRGALLVRAHARQPAALTSRPFRLGLPVMDATSCETWARLVSRWTRGMRRPLFEYGDPAGYRPLREAIATYLGEARGVRCSSDQVVVVSGAQQGIDLSARVLLDPGEAVCVEDPCYPGARAALAAAGLRLCPVPVDSEGFRVGVAAGRPPVAKLAYVTPSHQNPLGVTMSLVRRLALLKWAERTRIWILEDDHNSQYRYASRPLAALQGLDTAGRVIYLGSFSKVLFPALRIGYLVVPPGLADVFIAAGGRNAPPRLVTHGAGRRGCIPRGARARRGRLASLGLSPAPRWTGGTRSRLQRLQRARDRGRRSSSRTRAEDDPHDSALAAATWAERASGIPPLTRWIPEGLSGDRLGLSDQGIVPHRYQIAVRGGKVWNLEVGVPEGWHAAWHPDDSLPHHRAGRVERLPEHAERFGRPPRPADNVAPDALAAGSGPRFGGPVDRKLLFPPRHEGRDTRGGAAGRGPTGRDDDSEHASAQARDGDGELLHPSHGVTFLSASSASGHDPPWDVWAILLPSVDRATVVSASAIQRPREDRPLGRWSSFLDGHHRGHERLVM